MESYYRNIFDVVRDFLHEEAMEGLQWILDRYLKPDVLIIDDMSIKQLPKRVASLDVSARAQKHDDDQQVPVGGVGESAVRPLLGRQRGDPTMR